MDEELLQAACASGLAYDMLDGFGCSVDEADFLLSIV